MDPPQPFASSPALGPVGGKIRLMCSFGGQIAPRPGTKTLCYSGGDTRIVAVDRRNITVSSLTSHLSRSLLNNHPFSLKYQLPNHDLDSLVSVTTDEDLVNMIEEYDRVALSPVPSRLRFFLFPVAKQANSGEFDARSEAWFVDSLRSARIDADSGSGAEGQGDGAVDSVFIETNSSFGSTGSAASVSSLPVNKGGAGEEVGLVQAQDLKVHLPPLDSVASDVSSITSSNFHSPTLMYLDSIEKPELKESKFASKFIEAEISSSEIAPTPMQVYGYSLCQPMDHLQQQPIPKPQPKLQSYLQPQPQYTHPPASSQYPTQYYPSMQSAAPYTTPSYHNLYLHQQPQQPSYAINKPYPVYLMPMGQRGTPTVISSTSPAMMMTTPKMVYDGFAPAQPVVVPPPTQAVAVSSVVDSKYGGGEYDDSLHASIYKTQPPPPIAAVPTPLHQPMTNAATMMLDSTKQQVRI